MISFLNQFFAAPPAVTNAVSLSASCNVFDLINVVSSTGGTAEVDVLAVTSVRGAASVTTVNGT